MVASQRSMRLGFLDGLRGWAAVVVLFHHIFVDGLPAQQLYGRSAFLGESIFYERHVCGLPLLCDLRLFAIDRLSADRRGLARMAAGRYVRLALPIFAICAITYLLLILNIIPPSAQRPSPLDVFATFTPTLNGLFEFSLFGTFVFRSHAESYNPPLWTMFYEFLGSFMVFAIVAVLRSWRLRTWILGALFAVLALYGPFFSLFVAGILIADLFQKKEFEVRQTRRRRAVCRRPRSDVVAGNLVGPEVCGRTSLPCRRCCAVCPGEMHV